MYARSAKYFFCLECKLCHRKGTYKLKNATRHIGSIWLTSFASSETKIRNRLKRAIQGLGKIKNRLKRAIQGLGKIKNRLKRAIQGLGHTIFSRPIPHTHNHILVRSNSVRVGSTGPARPTPTRPKPNRPEPTRPKTDPTQLDPSRRDPNRQDPSRPKPSQRKPTRPDPSIRDPNRQDMPRPKPSQPKPTRTNRPDPTKADPNQTGNTPDSNRQGRTFRELHALSLGNAPPTAKCGGVGQLRNKTMPSTRPTAAPPTTSAVTVHNYCPATPSLLQPPLAVVTNCSWWTE